MDADSPEGDLAARKQATEAALDRLAVRRARALGGDGRRALAVATARRDLAGIALRRGERQTAASHLRAAIEDALRAADRARSPADTPPGDRRRGARARPRPGGSTDRSGGPDAIAALSLALWCACVLGDPDTTRPVAFEVLTADPPSGTARTDRQWALIRYAAALASRDAVAAATASPGGRGGPSLPSLRRSAHGTESADGAALEPEALLVAGLDAVADGDGRRLDDVVRRLAAVSREASRTTVADGGPVSFPATALVALGARRGLAAPSIPNSRVPDPLAGREEAAPSVGRSDTEP
jgi:hypothetical protein